MIVYMTLLSYWGFIAFLVNVNSRLSLKYNSKLFTISAGVSLFLVMALKGETVGTDTLAYSNEYENAKYYLEYLLRPTELGYSYFNFVIKKLDLSFQSYLGIISAIVVISVSTLYRLHSKNILMSFYLHVTIGIFAMTMTGLRQTMAISLTIFAFIYLMRNKNLLFFIFILVAYFFHNSSLVFLLVFFLRKIRINKRTGFIIYVFCSLLFVCRGFIASLIMQIIPEKYTRYMLDVAYVNPLLIIVVMAIPLACLLLWPRASDLDNEDEPRIMSMLFLLSCLNFIIYFFALEISLFERMSFYFMIYNTVLIPNVIQKIKHKNIRAIAKVASIILPLLQFLISTPGGSMGIDDYKFFWELED